MENLCRECKINVVKIKKRQLCKSCYAKWYKKERRKNPKKNTVYNYAERKISNQCEMDFVRSFFKHNNWIYLPAIFRLNGINYEPDFYDGERNVFIEVVGSRQAFHQNKHKYLLFIKLYPKITFEVRHATGDLKHI